MIDLFWNIFKKSGNIDAFLAYKEYNNYQVKRKILYNKNIKKEISNF